MFKFDRSRFQNTNIEYTKSATIPNRDAYAESFRFSSHGCSRGEQSIFLLLWKNDFQLQQCEIEGAVRTSGRVIRDYK